MAQAYNSGRTLGVDALDAWRAAVTPYLSSLGAGKVLDLGAGTGRFSNHLSRWSDRGVVAVEPATAMACQAEQGAVEDVEVVIGRAEAIPLRDSSVQVAWLSQVIHHISDLERAAMELARVVKPDGYVLLRGALGRDAGASGRGPDFALYRYFPGARRVADGFPSRRRVREAFRSAGLVEEVSTEVHQVTATSLRDLLVRVATRADSTLAALDDAEFAAGLAALKIDAEAEEVPQHVIDRLDFVVLRNAR